MFSVSDLQKVVCFHPWCPFTLVCGGRFVLHHDSSFSAVPVCVQISQTSNEAATRVFHACRPLARPLLPPSPRQQHLKPWLVILGLLIVLHLQWALHPPIHLPGIQMLIRTQPIKHHPVRVIRMQPIKHHPVRVAQQGLQPVRIQSLQFLLPEMQV